MKSKKWYFLIISIFSLGIIFSGCLGNGEGEVIPTHFNLTIEQTGEGDVNPKSGVYEIEKDTFVDLEARKSSFAWDFSEWEGDVGSSTVPKTNVYMNEEKTVKAIFSEEIERDIYTRSSIKDADDEDKLNDESPVDYQVGHGEDEFINRILFFKTTEGNYGKMLIVDMSYYNSDGWVFSIITFKTDGTVEISLDEILVNKDYFFDLDTGLQYAEENSDVDFELHFWETESAGGVIIRPQNDALFYLTPLGTLQPID